MTLASLPACPFCGGHPYRRKTLRDGYEKFQTDPDAYAYFVACNSCAAQGGWAKTEAGGDRLWKTRQAQEHVSMIDAGDPMSMKES